MPEYDSLNHIIVRGAREHNLKNVNVDIPRNKLVVVTGVSGSGKSSLAFNTIYAEGQRRYIESFNAYARQFLGNIERPQVDVIEGLSPVISIEQKSTNRNPRSTVGTVTEIYDFVRLLYARASIAYSINTGKAMVQLSEAEIIEKIETIFANKKVYILAPLVRSRKGHYRELFEEQLRKGFIKIRIDGDLEELKPRMQVDRYVIHDIELVVDMLKVDDKNKQRLIESIQSAIKIGNGLLMMLDYDTGQVYPFSKNLMCIDTGISYDEPSPNSFSFNSPYGACSSCNGLGHILKIDVNKLITDNNSSIFAGGIAPLGEYRDNTIFKELERLAKSNKFSLSTPLSQIDEKLLKRILYGNEGSHDLTVTLSGNTNNTQEVWYTINNGGVVGMLRNAYKNSSSEGVRRWAEEYMSQETCSECNGSRLKQEALYFKVSDKNIAELSAMDITELSSWFEGIEKKLNKKQVIIAKDVLKEIRMRLGFLLHVGLGYLSLNRATRSLSGGETQRIRLATQIGSQLSGITYILDEPSIGLHQRDNQQLIIALKKLTTFENTVIVVEHDEEIMMESDYIIDIGPKAGIHGGTIVAQGIPSQFIKADTVTAQYLNGHKSIAIPKKRRQPKTHFIKLIGASGNNLKNVDIQIPLGLLVGVSGVSGSGKSTLINETLWPLLSNSAFKNSKKESLPFVKIEGLKHIDKVIEIDQSPIGRTPRSNPATYIGIFNDIRNLYAEMKESKIRGYKPGRFSFNVKGGRCETCEGGGIREIEMNLLPNVEVPCETCQGKRYNRETLEIRYKGKSISDVLNMTFEDAEVFFEALPNIARKIKLINEVGLSYLQLGQQATTLSGGEAQRVKLSSELSKKDTGNTFYILDEPTTGLHFQDIQILLDVMQRLVEKGNTVLVIEHNLDVLKVCDYMIDLGPEGGAKGGEIIAEGTPEQIAKCKKSHTGNYLKKILSNKKTPKS